MTQECPLCRRSYDARFFFCPACGSMNPAPNGKGLPRRVAVLAAASAAAAVPRSAAAAAAATPTATTTTTTTTTTSTTTTTTVAAAAASPAASSSSPSAAAASGAIAAERFLAHTYRIPFYRPSTNLGHFGVELDPRRGKMTVRVGMTYLYNSGFYTLAHGLGQTPPSGHDLSLMTMFQREAERVVPALWNGRFAFCLERTGWPPIEIRTEFLVEAAPAAAAHYQVELSDGSASWTSATVTEQPRVGAHGPHFATFSSDTVTAASSADKLRDMIEDLVVGYDIPLPDYEPLVRTHDRTAPILDALLAPRASAAATADIWGPRQYDEWRREAHAMPRVIGVAQEKAIGMARRQLRMFVSELRKVLGTTEYSKFRLQVRIRAPGAQQDPLLHEVLEALSSREIAIMIAERVTAGTPGQSSISIRLRSAEVPPTTRRRDEVDVIAAAVRRSSLMATAQFAQVTLCHEFGHMLGLPDEYVCITERSRDLLRALTINPVENAFSLDRWLDFQAPEAGRVRDNPVIADNQARFLTLCRAAGVSAPMFGRRTSSLMSGGSTFAPCHAVTLWEALTTLTRAFIDPAEWRIFLRES